MFAQSPTSSLTGLTLYLLLQTMINDYNHTRMMSSALCQEEEGCEIGIAEHLAKKHLALILFLEAAIGALDKHKRLSAYFSTIHDGAVVPNFTLLQCNLHQRSYHGYHASWTYDTSNLHEKLCS